MFYPTFYCSTFGQTLEDLHFPNGLLMAKNMRVGYQPLDLSGMILGTGQVYQGSIRSTSAHSIFGPFCLRRQSYGCFNISCKVDCDPKSWEFGEFPPFCCQDANFPHHQQDDHKHLFVCPKNSWISQIHRVWNVAQI